MNRTLKFTIWHGLAVSLALHSALALPFVVQDLEPPPDDTPPLIVQLQGVVADEQLEEKVVRSSPDQPQQQSQPTPPPPQEAPPPVPQEDGDKPPEPQQASTPPQPVPPPQARQVQDPDERQKAQILKAERDLETDRLREYVKRLSKKVRRNLIPQQHGNTMVALTVTSDGQIKPGSLRVAESSGRPKLDASALATVRASAPFEPPPYEMKLNFNVGYGKNK